MVWRGGEAGLSEMGQMVFHPGNCGGQFGLSPEPAIQSNIYL